MKNFFNRYAIYFAFIVALVAMCGSLYCSEVLHWTPCPLCWFQRIFMYPQTVLLFVAIVRNDRNVKQYCLPLSVIGSIFSIYQILIEYHPSWDLQTVTLCTASGVSCASTAHRIFGFFTLPMLAFLGFLLIVLFLSFGKKEVKPSTL